MNNKEATFRILEAMPDNYSFPGHYVRLLAQERTHKSVYIATILRYMREWRVNNREIICTNKVRSMYMIRGKNEN